MSCENQNDFNNTFQWAQNDRIISTPTFYIE